MDNRVTNRYRMIILAALGAAMALGSFWVLEVMRKGVTDIGSDSVRVDPDFYVEKFKFLRLAQSGEAQYVIAGKRLIHNPVDDSYEIEMPVVDSLSTQRPPMTARANRARVEDDHSKVHLYNRVEVDRPATADVQAFQLRSEYMLLLPDEDIIRSDKLVDMTLGASTLRGVGMIADNAKRELRLLSDVHATHQPPLSKNSR